MKTYSMEEEIKQKLELGFNPKYAGATNDLLDLISQALQKRDEEWLQKIRNYQNGWIIAHDQGPDDFPLIELAPEYDVIEQLITTLTTK